MIRQALSDVGKGYVAAIHEGFSGHPLANTLRRDLPAYLRQSLGPDADGLLIEGSAGQGRWAEVPWVAFFEPSVTESATSGYYPVYLFSIATNQLHLSLNQGTTRVTEEFRSEALRVLKGRAELMRQRVADFRDGLPEMSISLGSAVGKLGRGYVAGHAIGKTYDLNNLPSEEVLLADLRHALEAYRELIFRGGLDFFGEASSTSDNPGGSIDEERRYRMHYRIERNSRAARLAKSHHGYTCQVCDFNFYTVYGDIGKDFIEAHHLKPISSLEAGTKVRYDVATDFAVLCSNCHRMVHRTTDPSDLQALRNSLQKK